MTPTTHCKMCLAHYGDHGQCDEGMPMASPHRAARARAVGIAAAERAFGKDATVPIESAGAFLPVQPEWAGFRAPKRRQRLIDANHPSLRRRD